LLQLNCRLTKTTTNHNVLAFHFLILSTEKKDAFSIDCIFVGEGINSASLAIHVGLGSQPPPLTSALNSTHYFSGFSGINMPGTVQREQNKILMVIGSN